MKEAEERQSFLTRIAVECSDEAGIEIDEAKKLLLGDLSLQSEEAMVIEKLLLCNKYFLIRFNAFQCFVRCIFKKEGFWNEADEPQINYIVDSLQFSVNVKRKKLKKIIKKCAEIQGENPCKTAFQVFIGQLSVANFLNFFN